MNLMGPYQMWGNPEAPTTLFFREGNGYRISFPGIVDFLVSPTGEVSSRTTDGEAAGRWRVFYEQQVEPLLLSLRGEQVFHGGAIRVGEHAVAFLAPSGRGKSTLTTAFARRGYPFLSDDCLHLDLTGPEVQAIPHANYVRLWEDSAAALGQGAAAFVPGSPKSRLAAGSTFPHCDRRLPLARAYLLGDGGVDVPMITPVSPSQALIGWTSNAFVLDIKNPEVLRRNLAAGARLVAEVPMRRLDYPRRYAALDSVVDAVLADVGA